MGGDKNHLAAIQLDYRLSHRTPLTCGSLENFIWRRVIRWWMHLHRWKWTDVRRRFTDHTGRWRRPAADGIELFNIASVPVTRYRYRGSKIPNPWITPDHT